MSQRYRIKRLREKESILKSLQYRLHRRLQKKKKKIESSFKIALIRGQIVKEKAL